MKWFLFIILLFVCVAGCSTHLTNEEAIKYFNTNEESFNQIEELFLDNKIIFRIDYFDYPIKDKKYQFEVSFADSASKMFNVEYYLPKNFTVSDSTILKIKEKLNLNYDTLKALTDTMIKMDCHFAIFFPGYFILDDFENNKRELKDTQYLKKIKGNWYHNTKDML